MSFRAGLEKHPQIKTGRPSPLTSYVIIWLLTCVTETYCAYLKSVLQKFRPERSHTFLLTGRVTNHQRSLLKVLVDSVMLEIFKSKYSKRYVLVQTELIQGSPMTSVTREVR